MKLIIFLGCVFFSTSFMQHPVQPIYTVSYSSTDCYFFILVNNKEIYKNESQYKVTRSIPIEKYLEKNDSQRIEYFMYPRHTMMELTEKSKLEVFVIKQIGEKFDTLHRSNLRNFGSKDEKGKMRFATRIGGNGYFLLD